MSAIASAFPPETQLAFEFMKYPGATTAMVVNMLSEADRLGDRITLPEHYARFEIEPIRFICENNLNFFQGNIVKYILRWDAKNGLEDLEKAQRYLTMFIKWVKKDPDWWRATG